MKSSRSLGRVGYYALCFAAVGLVLGCTSSSKEEPSEDGEPSETGEPSASATDSAPAVPTDSPASPGPVGDDTTAPDEPVGPDPGEDPTPEPTPEPTTPAVDPAPDPTGPEPTDTPEPTTPTPEPTDTPEPNTDPNMGAGGMDSGAMTPEPEPTMTNEPEEQVPCETPEEDTFSFFMISYDAIRRFSGSDQGFGGDLGGITGADSLCERAAMESSTCAGNKQWRAFLSTTQEDAIDRIGTGPWHDRVGRLLANNLEELLNDRPPNAHPEIIDDFPNEYGIPNQYPNSDAEAVDNHQTLTGTGTDGRLYTQDAESGMEGPGGGSTQCPGGWTPEKATCWDWTSKEPDGCPRVGHSWPSELSGVNWMSVWNESGCAPGVVLVQGPFTDDNTVGSYGGYGGFYCFAMTGE
jgi:hypothetical protein